MNGQSPIPVFRSSSATIESLGSNLLSLEAIEQALHRPLPGAAAQARMSTRPRSASEEQLCPDPPRQGAVLVLLYADRGQVLFPLTRRTDSVAHHKGQISLPGGAWEEGDQGLWETALRETEEEIGVLSGSVRFLGPLSPLFIPPSNFEVHPFAGSVPGRPPFALDRREVAELIEVPVILILDPQAKAEEIRRVRGKEVLVPSYRFREHIIWGATAMILSELEALLIG